MISDRQGRLTVSKSGTDAPAYIETLQWKALLAGKSSTAIFSGSTLLEGWDTGLTFRMM